MTRGRRGSNPWYAWLAAAAAVSTGVPAIPVGVMFILDPGGGSVGLPGGWIESTAFGSYLIPGLYLLLVNGVGMLLLAWLIARGNPLAPWLTGILGPGLIVWILVQLAIMPETMVLQWVFLGIGILLTAIALAWLPRRGGHEPAHHRGRGEGPSPAARPSEVPGPGGRSAFS